MVTIFLCDDNKQTINKYDSLITYLAKKNRITFTLSTYESGEALLFHLADSPNLADIIYLDVLMGTLNGVDTAKRLRELGCDSQIIFLTTSEDYVFEAFDASPVQYLIKNSTSVERFEEILLRAISRAEGRKTEMFVYESGGVRKVIPMKEISYFEIWKRLVKVHTKNGESVEYYGTMEQLEKQMQDKDFLRVHRSYMVNLQYIGKFTRPSLILKTGEVIPIGVTYAKLVDQAFSEYISRLSIHR
ncbi:response regulator [Anaerocolumna sedimenticola]|uniref:Stage 0 sporulation protein A homolog n=1 Tax=Anaerocolumna sedimenticola TaxID=2696063 RepID=A0A6P1TMV4_9FIRM|nr:LytTR family DNA-binding domain-containing protein [Anaerocolumna sedimenticola]QHQ61519.1 response regulator [Anaerocolumna sedimenticola]